MQVTGARVQVAGLGWLRTDDERRRRGWLTQSHRVAERPEMGMIRGVLGFADGGWSDPEGNLKNLIVLGEICDL